MDKKQKLLGGILLIVLVIAGIAIIIRGIVYRAINPIRHGPDRTAEPESLVGWQTDGPVRGVIEDSSTGSTYIVGDFDYVGKKEKDSSLLLNLENSTYVPIKGFFSKAESDRRTGGWFLIFYDSNKRQNSIRYVNKAGIDVASWKYENPQGIEPQDIQLTDDNSKLLVQLSSRSDKDDSLIALDPNTGNKIDGWSVNYSEVGLKLREIYSFHLKGSVLHMLAYFEEVQTGYVNAYLLTIKQLDGKITRSIKVSEYFGGIEAFLARKFIIHNNVFYSVVNNALNAYNMNINNATLKWSVSLKTVEGRWMDWVLDQARNRILVFGDFQGLNSSPQYKDVKYLALINASSGMPDNTLNIAVDGAVYAIEINASTSEIYMGGTFRNVNGQTKLSLARLSANTGQLFESPNVGKGVVESIFSDQSVTIAINNISSVGGYLRSGIVEIDKNERVTAWDARVDRNLCPKKNYEGCSEIYTAEVRGDKIYIAGKFAKVQDQNRSSIAVLDKKTGELLEPFSGLTY